MRHHATPHGAILHYTILYHTSHHHTTAHHNSAHYTTLHYTALHYTTLHCTTLHYTTLHYTRLQYTTKCRSRSHFLGLISIRSRSELQHSRSEERKRGINRLHCNSLKDTLKKLQHVNNPAQKLTRTSTHPHTHS